MAKPRNENDENTPSGANGKRNAEKVLVTAAGRTHCHTPCHLASVWSVALLPFHRPIPFPSLPFPSPSKRTKAQKILS